MPRSAFAIALLWLRSRPRLLSAWIARHFSEPCGSSCHFMVVTAHADADTDAAGARERTSFGLVVLARLQLSRLVGHA